MVGRMTTAKPESERASRLDYLLRAFKQANDNGEEILLAKTRARLQLRYGITAKTANDYLATIADAGFIEILVKEDRILWRGQA